MDSFGCLIIHLDWTLAARGGTRLRNFCDKNWSFDRRAWIEPRTDANVEHRTSNIELPTSNVEY